MTTEPILVDPSADDLASAVEENLFALFRAMAISLDGEVVERDGLSYHLAFPSNPMFKGVWRPRLAATDVDAAIAAAGAWLRERKAPFAFWWTGPGTTPADWGDRLAACGLLSMAEQQRQFAPGIRSTEIGGPGMVADLDRMNEAALEQVPAGFTLAEVADAADLDEFKRVFVEGNGVPEWAGQAWVDAAQHAGIGHTPWRMYLGRLNGEAVATNMLFCGAGVASVYGVATVPTARGRGIGGAITLAPLLDARRQGFRHAVLFATDLAVGTYRRIGFRECGVRINRYLWRNE
jgi:ribosomal protein S18 acetylase RimI-like enzyme